MNYLTYFTSRTKDELNSIIVDLCSILGRSYISIDSLANKIVDIFVNNFDADSFYAIYNIDVSNGFIAALNKTLQNDADMIAFMDYVYYEVSRLLQ